MSIVTANELFVIAYDKWLKYQIKKLESFVEVLHDKDSTKIVFVNLLTDYRMRNEDHNVKVPIFCYNPCANMIFASFLHPQLLKNPRWRPRPITEFDQDVQKQIVGKVIEHFSQREHTRDFDMKFIPVCRLY